MSCIEQVGSTHFTAPEVLLHQSYSRAADVWSAGVMLYLLLCGHLPFDGPQLRESICQGAFDVRILLRLVFAFRGTMVKPLFSVRVKVRTPLFALVPLKLRVDCAACQSDYDFSVVSTISASFPLFFS